MPMQTKSRGTGAAPTHSQPWQWKGVGIPLNKIRIITILKMYTKIQDLQYTTPNMKVA
jgi:hypothetical protein